jgi:hypothetical protein
MKQKTVLQGQFKPALRFGALMFCGWLCITLAAFLGFELFQLTHQYWTKVGSPDW